MNRQIIFLFLLLFSNLILLAQENIYQFGGRSDYFESISINSLETNYITYDDYIESIRNNLPSVEINILDVDIAQNNLTSEQGSGDINLTANLGLIGTKGETLSYVQIPGVEDNAMGPRASIGVGSLIPYTGTRWQVSLTSTTLYFDGIDNIKYKPSVNIAIQQPLLKNIFGMADRFSISDARVAVDIAKDTSALSNNTLLVQYEKIYYQWIGLEKSLENIDKALSNARRFETRTRSRYNSAMIDNDSYQMAKVQTFQYMDMASQYRENILSLINTLRFFIDNQNVIRPEHQEWLDYLEIAMNEKPEFVPFYASSYGSVANKNGQRIASVVAVRKNLTLPDLSLIAGASIGANDWDSGYFNSFTNMTNANYYIGLKFEYPLGDRTAKADLQNAQAELEKFNMNYRNMVLNYNTKMNNTILRYEMIIGMIETKKSLIATLENALRTQTAKFNQGRQDITDLINTENQILIERLNLDNLEFQLISNHLDYKELFVITHYLQ